ncbi:polysaccharide pyruvyl transferase family protein [Treponema zuelzerae]|uniref:Polysaccharide pyruvyl transferase family protein n=1 Tax=Teretinema zuelzerae TaxID=156 RepID=A0AAE3EF22_9SPIR|nr:polysaccharide pyruvyl transferase family protein [Teretinema zuelzerae]MCD1653162.1 polysaccharide pyruvyl transferase family protein [Teretinema zuelzerae]
MKIGVMTFWWSEDNYGQLLQCFALQKYLIESGHDAFLIRYDPRNDYKKDKFRVFKILNPKLVFFKITSFLFSKKKTNRQFNTFRSDFIKSTNVLYHHYKELVEHPPIADMYITGSDQVWNFPDSYVRYENLINAYFLNFGASDIKRISFAASFSRQKIGKSLQAYIKPLLSKFDYVTVREIEGLSLCRSLGCNNAKLILDPTFLINSNQYPITEKKDSNLKYIFVYLLGSKCYYPKTQIEQFASENHLGIKYVYSQGNMNKGIEASIHEWISLICNSEYVITNSFHGTVFAILFNKKFVSLPLSSFFKEANTRLNTLLSFFQLEDSKYQDDIKVCVNYEINWNSVNEKIIKYRDSISYLFY